MPKNTAVFILSSQRSGSTWTGYVLGSHSSSAFLGEYFRAWRPEISVPCSFCSARHEERCPVLGGIEQVPERNAFDFAFDRTGQPVLVDASKDVAWAGNFINSGFNVKLIHLVRDPRGYFFSQRRRLPVEFWPGLISRWVEENVGISDFVRGSGLPFKAVFYDNLAGDPELFTDIFQFLDLQPESSALRYWTRDHHGFAANGASSLLLRQFSEEAYTTGDDKFYDSLGLQNFHDQRWIEGLSPEEKQSIETNPDVVQLLAENGALMTHEGLRIDRSKPARSGLRGVLSRWRAPAKA